MASHRLPRVLGVCSALCALALFAAAAAAGPPGAARGADRSLPRITGLKILALSTTGKLAPCPDMNARKSGPRRAKTTAAPGKACAEAVASSGTSARFRLAILGENLTPEGAPAPAVGLDTEDPGRPVTDTAVDRVLAKEIDISGEAPVPTTIKSITVRIGGGSCVNAGRDAPADCRSISSPPGLTISITANPTPALAEFQVKMEHHADKEFPNLHSLLVTRQSGDSGAGFAAKASYMQVDLEPTGATDLTIAQTNEQLMALRFVAAADYVPKNVVVTVFDGSDVDKRKPIALAKPAKPPEDPNAPKISDVTTDFLDRARGNGRIHIFGKGFGKVKRPGYPVDDYLCDCLERPNLSGYRSCSYLGDVQGPNQRTRELNGELNDDSAPINEAAASAEEDAQSDAVRSRDKSAHRQAKHERAAEHKAHRHEPIEEGFCPAFEPAWTSFQEALRGHVTVAVNSRDQAIRVEKAYVIDMNDDMIDVYFEFTRYYGYAWPFRLSGVDLTVTKDVKKTETVKADGISAAVAKQGPATFTAARAIGPKPDPNLTYQYTVLDYDGAKSQLGSIVADNFFVVQLSVVNTGKKKVSVPLAGIQAEVEWLYGDGRSVGKVQEIFMEGPPTLAPIPLAEVSGFFGMYQKSEGRRVRVFNILEGITTLASALVPFAGPALKDAEIVFSGGFIPGLRQAWVDLSAQQLQNLTSLSWQDSEVVAASGGSIGKYVFIQRKPQFADEDEFTGREAKARRTVKQISNILNIEVTGFEVPETPAKEAAPKSTAKQTSPKESEPPSDAATSSSSEPEVTPAPETSGPPPRGQ